MRSITSLIGSEIGGWIAVMPSASVRCKVRTPSRERKNVSLPICTTVRADTHPMSRDSWRMVKSEEAVGVEVVEVGAVPMA